MAPSLTQVRDANFRKAIIGVNAMKKDVWECRVMIPTGDVVKTNSRMCMHQRKQEQEKRRENLATELLKNVKNGLFTTCPDKTIKKAVDDFLGSPKWKHAVSKEESRSST